MPSYLDDEHGTPIFSTSEPIISLDPAKFGLAAGAASHASPNVAHDDSNANTSITTDASFDETCETESTGRSDVTDVTPLPPKPNGVSNEVELFPEVEGTWPPSMASMLNGRSLTEEGEETHTTAQATPIQNGSAITVVDRTAEKTGGHGIETTKQTPASPKTSSDVAPVRTSVGSMQQLPVEFYQRTTKSGNASPVDGSAAASLNMAPTSFVTPASPLQSPDKKASSAHRFSSPPQYNPGASSSAALHPQPPGQLRQRHTLEVPKLSSGRASKDGVDAFASGRFSPTTGTAPRRASLSLGRRNTRSIQSDFPRDEVFPDDDAIRWAEAVRQKRASKKRRREEEDDDRVLVGTKVDEHHVNWVTAYNMLTGIRVSVSRTNAKLDRELTDADFEAKQKSTFDV